jgi:outer membrane lipoprotein-sorting protein/ribosomal protein L31E
VLSGWLYQTARLTAANFVKGEIRRHHREQEAYMQSTLNEPDAAAWEQIAPLLDEAMGRLGETDRNAVVLRFFENKTAQEVGAKLKLNEAAAHKRVSRAVEKLRKFFTKRGVTLSAMALGGALAANSVQAAPMSLAVTVTAAAAKGTLISATITTLVKGTMKMMTWLKLKFAIGVSVAVLLVGGAVTVAISQASVDSKLTPQEIIKNAQEAYAALSSYSDTGKKVTERGKQTETITFNIRLQRPDLYRIEWSKSEISGSFNQNTILTANSSKGVVWSAGNGNFFAIDPNGQKNSFTNLQMALNYTRGVSGEASSTIPGVFFNLNWPRGYGENVLNQTNAIPQRKNDEKINGVDCYVVSSGHAGTKTLWIGKRDYLIHQTRTIVEEFNAPRSDSEIKAILESQNQPATPEAIASVKTAMKQVQTMKVVSTQTHENISVNQKFSPADFAH